MSDDIAKALRTLAEENGTSLFLGELQTLERAATMLEAGGWQPIETAPKDGAEILGIQFHGRFSDPGIVRWDDFEQEWWDIDADQYGFPTHWLPLPALLSSPAGEANG